MRFKVRRAMVTFLSFLLGGSLLLGGGVIAYRRFTQPPPQVMDFIKRYPDQPKPELVGSGISPALVLLILTVALVFILAGIFVAWKWQR